MIQGDIREADTHTHAHTRHGSVVLAAQRNAIKAEAPIHTSRLLTYTRTRRKNTQQRTGTHTHTHAVTHM